LGFFFLFGRGDVRIPVALLRFGARAKSWGGKGGKSPGEQFARGLFLAQGFAEFA